MTSDIVTSTLNPFEPRSPPPNSQFFFSFPLQNRRNTFIPPSMKWLMFLYCAIPHSIKELIYCGSDATDFHRISWKEIVKFYTGCGLFEGDIIGRARGLIEGLRAVVYGDTL
ncbi:hypothetical protein AMTR_s00154p00035810 [Amborella trichopoda]|uniref:Uncharacterized protein n=1 Tax=Amborella trichopoda TaxID=13333 RepID=W1PC67_AMBTC|nr:hypothetical protein AMTR_s00154p00035810 [Amborella trichopoda]